MKRILFRSVLVLGLVAGCLVTVPRLAAQELPRAEDILDCEAKAVAGKETGLKLKTVVMSGKVSVQGMQGRFASYQAAPDRLYVELTIDGLMTAETGVRGDLAWERSSLTGPRILKGGERARALRDANSLTLRDAISLSGNWRDRYKQVKTLGEEKVEGRPAYKLQLTTREGYVVIAHYDKQTGLLVRQEITVESPQGRENQVMFFSNYRRVDGIAHPHTIRAQVGPAEVVLTVERVEHNMAIPEARFAVPADVQRLLARQSKS
jgi:hypothetical protein